MTREQFDTLVRQVEQGIGRDPKALRRRVVLWALVGYAGFLSWVFAVLLLAGAFLGPGIYFGKDGWILIVVGSFVLLGGGGVVIKSLWVRLELPQGRILKRGEAPALFTMLDDLRAKLRSSAFDRVLIVPHYNASVVQSPRLGVLGWWRSYLLIGLPLMESLSAAELRAVLAHEFAHLSKEHGRFGHWLYRLRRAWEQIFEQLRRPRAANEVTLRPLIVKFVEWFWPRFDAHAFVFSRANEYEADSIAASLAGSDHIAAALTRIAVFGKIVDETFWQETWLRANTEPLPPVDVFSKLTAAMTREPAESDRIKWCQEALRATTTNTDTHPCLRERLQALQFLPGDVASIPWPTAAENNAATALLGPALEGIRDDLQSEWAKTCADHWRDRHSKAHALQHRLSALEQHAPVACDVDALWDKARVMIDLEGDAAAEPLLRQILLLRPDHAPANFCLGRRLLEVGDAAGESHLEQAISGDEELLPQACGLLHAHFRAEGRTERLRELNARMDAHEKSLVESRRERSSVEASDTFVLHTLTEDELSTLRAQLSAEPNLYRAFLGQKQLRHFPKQRLFVLCVETPRGWHRLPVREHDESLARRLAQTVQLPGRVLVFAPHGSFRAIARKVQQVPGTNIFPISEVTAASTN
jgi:Zn-dependent protease with chaperone function